MDEATDLRSTQSRDPRQALEWPEVLANPGGCDHPPIAHENDLLQAETIPQLLDLGRQRLGVRDVAFEHLDGHRAAFRIGEKAKLDLELALAVVARVAQPSQGTMATLEVRRGQVVKHERSLTKVTIGEGGLDSALPLQQPVHSRVELVFIG